jgi:hypothetical protein
MVVHSQSFFDVPLRQGARRHVIAAGPEAEASDRHLTQSQA